MPAPGSTTVGNSDSEPEVAVSTQKLHARGPMGLEELTTYKWICIGDGHIRP